MNETRCHQLINQAISLFALDLSNMIVLTEAATGYYMLTPLIAALAGAERVPPAAARAAVLPTRRHRPAGGAAVRPVEAVGKA